MRFLQIHLMTRLLALSLFAFFAVQDSAWAQCVHQAQLEKMHRDHPEWMGVQRQQREALEAFSRSAPAQQQSSKKQPREV